MAPVGVAAPGAAPSSAKRELMTNAVCSYPLFARPWREGYEKHLAPFDALFIDCSSKDVARGVSNSHQSYRIMNLPLLNTFLAKHVFMKRSRKVNVNGVDQIVFDKNAAANAAIDELVANLCFIGTHRNDMQLSGGKPDHSHGGRTSAYRRLINIDCRGASRVRNLWPEARQGDRLAFVLVECPATASHVNSQLPTDSHHTRLGQSGPSVDVQRLKAQLRYMRTHGFADSACKQMEASIDQTIKAELKEESHVVLQCKPVVCRDGGNPCDTYLEPDETLRRVIDVGFVYEHVPRAFSPSIGAAKSAMTTFSGNDALPVISVFMRT